MPKTKTTTYTIRFRSDRTTDLAGFLDMLRYEGSRVEGWGRDGDHYTINLRAEGFRLDQEYVRDQNEKKPRTIEALRAAVAGSLGENVTIRRFALFELGQ